MKLHQTYTVTSISKKKSPWDFLDNPTLWRHFMTSSLFYDVISYFCENMAEKCWHKQRNIQYMQFWFHAEMPF